MFIIKRKAVIKILLIIKFLNIIFMDMVLKFKHNIIKL